MYAKCTTLRQTARPRVFAQRITTNEISWIAREGANAQYYSGCRSLGKRHLAITAILLGLMLGSALKRDAHAEPQITSVFIKSMARFGHNDLERSDESSTLGTVSVDVAFLSAGGSEVTANVQTSECTTVISAEGSAHARYPDFPTLTTSEYRIEFSTTIPFRFHREESGTQQWIAGADVSEEPNPFTATANLIPVNGTPVTAEAGVLAPGDYLYHKKISRIGIPFVPGIIIDTFSHELNLTPIIVGDYDGDGCLGLTDIDTLGMEITSGRNHPDFDLTVDGFVNGQDRDAWLLLANRWNGDANFNGSVDFPDFLIVAEHYSTTPALWSQGDFNSDGHVQFEDFLILANNFGKSAQNSSTAVVPEPSNVRLSAIALIVALSCSSKWRRCLDLQLGES